MNILTLDDFEFKDKTVLARVDLNCPIDPESKEFLNYRRIRKHAETVKELVENGAKVVLLAHQGRPGSEYDFTTTEKHAERLAELIGSDVNYIPDLIGPTALEAIKNMKPGEVLLLENVRFLAEELINRPADVQATTHFVRSIAPLVDYFINDAFAAAHRSQPSLVGFCEILPSAAGRVMQKEIETLDKVIKSNRKPSVYVAGGAKLKGILKAIDKFLSKGIVDRVLTTGLIANIFLIAKGYDVRGLEYVENYEAMLSLAKSLLETHGNKIEVPMDLAMDKYGERLEVSLAELPLPYRVADIGTGTIGRYKYMIENAGTIIANGPAGVFEEKAFAKGTNDIVKAIAESESFSILGGGHLATAVSNMDTKDKISHISTGGGACISYLAGDALPAIESLEAAAARAGKGKKQKKLVKK